MRSVRRRVVVVSLALTALVGASAARADDVGAKKEARTHFRAGTAYYEGGVYDKAIAEYEVAYKLMPLPDLLFNLGQAHRLNGDEKMAIDYYRRYLDAKSSGAVADEAREHLAELTAQQQQQQPTGTPPTAPVAPADKTVERPPTPAVAPTATTPAVTTHAAPTERHKRKWVWWAAGGAAVVVVGLGVGLGIGLGSTTKYPTTTFGEVMPK